MSAEPQITTFRLFHATAFIPSDEREEYNEFCEDYLRDLTPKTAVEDTLADEIIQAAWRLHRCTSAEQQEIPADMDPGQLERLQASIDRARATAQRVYHKSLTEFRRVRAEAQRDFAKQTQSPADPQPSIPDTRIPSASAFTPAFAKQSQSAPESGPQIARKCTVSVRLQ